MWTRTTSAQPARRRAPAPRGGRREQAVEQHDGAVRDPREHAGQGLRRRGVRPGPRAGHRVFAHQPAHRRELTADPAVVGVAAARRRRIVDPVRHHDVAPGSQRPLVAGPGDVRLVQRDLDPGQPARGRAELAGVDPLGEAVGDHLGQCLGGGVDAGERRLVVEVAVAQLADDRVQLLGGPPDVDHDVVGVEASRRKVASTT